MPFLCLERCTASGSVINATIATTIGQAGMLGAVSTERYNLGPGGKLVRAENLTDSVAELHAGNWPASSPIIAMVSSYPYPPEFATWMRAVFRDPGPFVASLKEEAAIWGLAGFNIDWEPLAKTIEPSDAHDYAVFLGNLGKELGAAGLSVTVDVATWSPLWNYTELSEHAAEHLDGVMVMSTYTDVDSTWLRELIEADKAFGADKLIVGLETTRANGTEYPPDQLESRFGQLRSRGLRRVGLWRAPVPAEWAKFLRSL